MTAETKASDLTKVKAGFEAGTQNKLTVARSLHVEQTDPAAATIFLSDSGARIRIPRALFDLIQKFETPQTISAVAGKDVRAASALQTMADRGFLTPPGEYAPEPPQRLVTDPPVRMFDCPASKPGSAASDVAIIGVPYDFADRTAAGARNGPEAIRNLSLQLLYQTDKLTGRPLGWYDADAATNVLNGVSIGDCGDIFIQHGEPQSDMFDRVSVIVAKAINDHALPVILGGDATVSFPAIQTIASRHNLAVVQIGHKLPDHTVPPPSFVSASSLKTHLSKLPQVASVIHVAPSTLQSVTSGESALDVSQHDMLDASLSALTAGLPLYLSFDIAQLAATPASGSSGQSGCDYIEVCALIKKIGKAHPIYGIDLTGLNPQQQNWGVTGMTALHILLQAISAAKEHNHTGAEA